MAVQISALAADLVARTNRIAIEYVRPTTAAHVVVFGLLKQRRVLERIQRLLSPVRLPAPLKIRTQDCDGESNAWYDEADRTVTICYEYFADLQDRAPLTTSAAGVTSEDAVTGPATEVFLHEVAHALFHLLRIPVLGREEDAADQIASYMLLRLDEDLSRRYVAAVAYVYSQEAKKDVPDLEHFSDVHSLPAQRLYNLLCMAYGADPVLFADALKVGQLPPDRAQYCPSEYAQVDYAFAQLIGPHIDRAMAKRIQAKRLFRR